jgi:hypothetical protein
MSALNAASILIAIAFLISIANEIIRLKVISRKSYIFLFLAISTTCVTQILNEGLNYGTTGIIISTIASFFLIFKSQKENK